MDIAIRPQHVKIDFDRAGRGPNETPENGAPAKAFVERARYLGKESLVEFRLEAGGPNIVAAVPAVFLPQPDTPMWLMIRRDRCFVFSNHN